MRRIQASHIDLPTPISNSKLQHRRHHPAKVGHIVPCAWVNHLKPPKKWITKMSSPAHVHGTARHGITIPISNPNISLEYRVHQKLGQWYPTHHTVGCGEVWLWKQVKHKCRWWMRYLRVYTNAYDVLAQISSQYSHIWQSLPNHMCRLSPPTMVHPGGCM